MLRVKTVSGRAGLLIALLLALMSLAASDCSETVKSLRLDPNTLGALRIVQLVRTTCGV